MIAFYRTDVNFIAAAVLGIILLIAAHRLDRSDKLNRAFFITGLIVILQLVIEAATCLVNGMPGAWIRSFDVFFHVVLFATAPTLTYNWYRLARRMTRPTEKMPKALLILILTPLAINLVMTIVSAFTGIFFSIDMTNVYHRGPLFAISAALTYFYLALALVCIFIDRRKFVREDIVLMALATVMPIVGGIVQSLFYGVLLMWSSVAFSLMILFIYLEQRLVRCDRLTGAWTRESFDYFIARRMRQDLPEPFAMILFDLDGLKEINDGYGHVEGDLALCACVNAVRCAIGSDDFIVRLGGDEFIAYIENGAGNVAMILTKAAAAIDEYNHTAKKPYRLSVSFGGDVYSTAYPDIESFIRHVDQLMYENKHSKQRTGSGSSVSGVRESRYHN
ncbi:MAG: diguanylate cyclase [bacterium]